VGYYPEQTRDNHMQKITGQESPKVGYNAVWGQAFRPFFLCGSAFSAVAIALWAALLGGHASFSPYANPMFWHAHEMLFGFVTAIITGFLLTAVQNWTGLRALNGKPLAALFSLWLSARALMAFNSESFALMTAALDISFLPAVALYMAQLVIRAKNYRNLVFVPVLLLLTAANALTHLSVALQAPHYFTWGMHAAILLVSLLMVVVAGRVLPMFTANGTGTPRVPDLPWLEHCVLALGWIIALVFAVNGQTLLPGKMIAVLLALAALANGCRALRWRPWITTGAPLVWSLHLAYWFIVLGFALLALHYAGLGLSASTALHALTAGAMGSLILAMIARVSLGHTGRPLTPASIMRYAFLLVAAAGVTRILAGTHPELLTNRGYMVSAILWVTAYSSFVFVYSSILTSPRPDGKPG
jgi:uncharacterized protein involved in response to NO